jgi:glycosyltransferase involved in cell wall biosynthesis
VPDLDPLYRSAGIFIVPLRAGSGIRVKILEAMARGVPVVSTTIGIEGLDVTPGEHVLVADEPQEFARAIRWLLAVPERRSVMAAAARELALAYDWRACLQPLISAYRDFDTMETRYAVRAGAAPSHS